MIELHKKLIIYKMELIKTILVKKDLDKLQLKELKTNLILVNDLINKLKLNNNVSCENEINQVEEFMLKIK